MARPMCMTDDPYSYFHIILRLSIWQYIQLGILEASLSSKHDELKESYTKPFRTAASAFSIEDPAAPITAT